MTKKDEYATAEYIALICKELAKLAETNGFSAGAYLLEMARLEFTQQQNRLKQNVSSG